MPAEAHRFQHRLGARDRWFLALLACVVVVGCAIALIASRQSGDASASADARCVSVIRASWMGGATFKYCGDEAASFCRKAPSSNREIVAECAEAGLIRTH